MKLPEIIPPADLLERVEGIKRGLRQRRRLGRLGWAGFVLASTLQIAVVGANSPFGKALWDLQWPALLTFVRDWWPYLLPALALPLFLVIASWASFWLQESKAPFRYTCSVAEFGLVAGAGTGTDSSWSWLSYDLAERLNQRIGRLRFIEAALVKPATAGFESHVHLSGSYGIRKDRKNRWVVEVTPRVRIGPPGSPETMAHAVVIPLAAAVDGAPPVLSALPAQTYDRILERVYFSVASELYKQIQRDVADRIELLPNDYFRAVALFHEAEDYARSNTLDAYEEARQLYGRSAELLDTSLKPLPDFRIRRAARRLVRAITRGGQRVRCVAASAWPRLGNVEVMCARAEIGYATMIVYRRELAGQSGQLVNTVYEARPVAERALARLTRLPKDVPGRQTTMFDARVVLALVSYYLGANRTGDQHLSEARRVDPNRTLENARYLYATGLAEHLQTSKLQTFRRVVELAPRFESAQVALAGSTEKLWRTRPVFERHVAEIVFAEYDEVSKINPGNIAAWANRGYMGWLLGEEQDLTRAQEAFESGREYKAIKQVTFVAELDYGLTRIAAERGDFRAAFEHYLGAVPAILGLGHASGTFEEYYFEHIGEPMFERFTRYRDRVEAHWALWQPPFEEPARSFDAWLLALRVDGDSTAPVPAGRLVDLLSVVASRLSDTDRVVLAAVIKRHAPVRETRAWLTEGLPGLARALGTADAPTAARAAALAALRDPELTRVVRRVTEAAGTARVRNVVLAFVLNDYGQACSRRYHSTGDRRSFEAAHDAYRRCIQLSPDYVMPYFNLHALGGDPDEGRPLLDRVIELAPEWPEGRLAYADLDASLAVTHHEAAESHREKAEQNRAAGLLDEAVRLARTADDEERKSQRLGDAVVRRLSGLVPHEWLWHVGSDGHAQFHWSALDDRDLARELVWERECGELHVRALFTLAIVSQGGGARSDAWRLLQHLHRHFWPDSFGIHRQLRKLLLDDIRALVKRPAFTETFSDATHRGLVDNDAARALLQQRQWLRLAWTQPASCSLLLRPRFLGVLRSRAYRALIDLPEIRSLPESEVQESLVRLAIDNVVRLLRGPGYEELLKQPVYLALASRDQISRPHHRALRSILRARRLHSLFDYADSDRTIRWHIERWLEDRQYPYWVLRWVYDASFASDEDPVLGPSDQRERGRRAIFERASELEGRVPVFYFRVADWLRDMESPAAVQAYLKAIRSDDAMTLHTVGLRLKELKELTGSLTAFRRAHEKDPQHVELFEWQHRSAAASVLWAQGSPHEAIAELRRIIDAPAVSWRTYVVKAMADLVTSADQAVLLRGWLESVRPRSSPPGPASGRDHDALADFHEAMLVLVRVRHERPTPSSPGLLSVVTPVALEVQAALLPEGDPWDIESLLSEMHTRIEREMGVRVPEVRVRSDDGSPAGTYTIFLDEVAEVTGTVIGGGLFCPSTETLARLSKDRSVLMAGVDPATGRAGGGWIAAFDVKGAAGAEAEAWNHFQFMIRHVEAVLRQRLEAFIGVQELQNTLEVWQDADGSTTPSRRDVVRAALPNTAARLQLLQVLRRLLREQVPIRDLGTILEVFAACPAADVSEAHLIGISETIRSRMRESLPGNHAGSRFVSLGPALEAEIDAHISESDGRMHLRLPPEHTRAVLGSVRHTFAGMPELDLVIVTRRERIRPYVHRLVELESPRVAVLSSRELLPRLRGAVSATIEYSPPLART